MRITLKSPIPLHIKGVAICSTLNKGRENLKNERKIAKMSQRSLNFFKILSQRILGAGLKGSKMKLYEKKYNNLRTYFLKQKPSKN